MRIAIAIHDPVWTIDRDQVRRIKEALPDDEVIHVDAELARLPAIREAEVFFGHRLAAPEYAAAARLKWIHSPSVGVANLLIPDVIRGAVAVTNSRGVHSEAIAEHALALLLGLRRHLHTAVRHQQKHEWVQAEVSVLCHPPLSHTQLLVIGLGTIGSRVARAAAALGMDVSAVRRDLQKPPVPGVRRIGPAARLREWLAEADAIVLTAPATADTRTMIGEAELAVMKPSASLVNVSRGELIDEAALVRALAARRLAGAGLDVFQREPLPSDHPFWDLPNILITPHIASFAVDFWPRLVDLFLDNVARYKRGDPLINPVDKPAGY